jgi:tRNA-dihydrouridine synthase A
VLADQGKSRAEVVLSMKNYCESMKGIPLRSVVRHMLGLYHGMPRARLWRRLLSDSTQLGRNDPGLLLEALEAVDAGSIMEAA